jgi:hypothetical protein
MRKVLVLAVRELWAWRALGWVALALAALVLTAPLWPRLGFQPAAEARGAVGLVLAAILLLGAALVVGSNLVSRELVEGRFGFYLALPARAWEIWLGRLLGAAGAVYGAGLVLLAPTLLLDGLPPLGAALVGNLALGTGSTVAAALCLPLVLLLLAHWLGLALRARSLWLALELAAVVVAALALWSVTTWLWSQLAGAALSMALLLVAALFLVGLLLAPWTQIAYGRSLIPRAHRAQAMVMTGSLVLGAALTLGWLAWLRSGEPSDLSRVVELHHAPEGEWIVVGGRVSRRADFSPAFLLNPSTSLHRRVGVATPEAWMMPPSLVFSSDGSEAVARSSPRGRSWLLPSEVLWMRLDGGGVEARSTGLLLDPGRWTRMALDGGRLALWSGDRLTLHDLAGDTTLGAFRLPEVTLWSFLAFRGNAVQVLRVGREGGSHLQVFTVDLSLRRLQEHPRHELPVAFWDLAAVDGASDRALLVGRSPDSEAVMLARLHDVGNGELVAELPVAARPLAARLLPGDLLLLAEPSAAGIRCRLFSASGEEILALPVLDQELLAELGVRGAHLTPADAGRRPVSIGWPWRPGRVPVAVGHHGGRGSSQVRLLEADLEAGLWRNLAPDLVPMAAEWRRQPSPSPGSLASRTFWRPARGELVRLDPGTGELETLLTTAGGPRASRQR